MAKILADQEIASLLAERKPITVAQVKSLHSPRKVKSNREQFTKLYVTGEKGRRYKLSVRWSMKKELGFSVMLSLVRGGRTINLVRCCGHHGPHINNIERTRIPADTCHIHQITERYQRMPLAEGESYAEPTDRYHGFHAAVDFIVWNYGLYVCDDEYGGGLFRRI